MEKTITEKDILIPMFTAARIWKESKCLLTIKGIKKMCIYTHIIVYTHTQWNTIQSLKNEIWPVIATWMDVEGFILSEISQTENGKSVRCHVYAEFKKYDKLVNITKEKRAHRHRE